MKFLLIVALSATAAAAPQHGYGHDDHHARPYAFDYAVNDPHYGAQFSQQEHGDGNNVEGQYSVVLPDGRTQNVKYHADHHGGYNAEVTYDGYAQAPAYHPAPVHKAPHHAASAYHAPKSVYHAAPVYHASKPVYHAAPVYHAPKPVYHAAPVYHASKPVYHPAPVHKAVY